MKQTRFLSLFLSLCLLLTACGGGAPTENGDFYRADADYAPNEIIEMETTAAMAPEELKSDDSFPEAPAQTDRKLIKTVSMDAETEHYDDLIAAIEEKLTALGGSCRF